MKRQTFSVFQKFEQRVQLMYYDTSTCRIDKNFRLFRLNEVYLKFQLVSAR